MLDPKLPPGTKVLTGDVFVPKRAPVPTYVGGVLVGVVATHKNEHRRLFYFVFEDEVWVSDKNGGPFQPLGKIDSPKVRQHETNSGLSFSQSP